MAAASVLDGKRCSVHPSQREDFTKRYPRVTVVDNPCTTDGNVITCLGGPVTIQLAMPLLIHDYRFFRPLAGMSDAGGGGLSVLPSGDASHDVVARNHPRVERATRMMNERMANPVSVSWICRTQPTGGYAMNRTITTRAVCFALGLALSSGASLATDVTKAQCEDAWDDAPADNACEGEAFAVVGASTAGDTGSCTISATCTTNVTGLITQINRTMHVTASLTEMPNVHVCENFLQVGSCSVSTAIPAGKAGTRRTLATSAE